MSRQHRNLYLTGGVAAAALVLILPLFLPSFGSQRMPETLGGDIIHISSDFAAGHAEGTVIDDEVAALTLAPERVDGDFTSSSEETDYPFNALGLHWVAGTPPGSSVTAEVRFSHDGEEWGDWHPMLFAGEEVPDHIGQTKSAGETIGQLVFTEGSTRFQYRLHLKANEAGQSPSVSRLTASYIDATGQHESSLSIATLWNRLGPGDGGGGISQASASPSIVSRAQWGANEAYMTWDPEYATPKKQIIHHTVTGNYDDPVATVRSIYYYHAVSLGWGDIGYNYLVDRYGRIFEGRYGGNSVIGGHALGWNTGTVGIAALGNFEGSGITPEMYTGFVQVLAWKANLHQINPYGATPMNGAVIPNIVGHRDTYSTACPGGNLYAYLPAFRAEVNARYSPWPIIGGILAKYEALNAAPGPAQNAEYSISGGMAQDFEHGRIMWNQATGRAYWINGAVKARYEALGRESSVLGWPVGDEYGIGVGRGQDFSGGRVYWHSTTGAWEVYGDILIRLDAVGGLFTVGFPISGELDVAGIAGARESRFQQGRIYWSAGDGARLVFGAIAARYIADGGPAAYGMPSGDEHDIPGVPGGRQHDFTGGRIYWHPATGPQAVSGDLAALYDSIGGPAGAFGLPVGGSFAAGGGWAQYLQGGLMSHGSSAGGHVLYGGILAKYLALGGPTGAFGLPTTDEADVAAVAGAREAGFTGGRIYWSGQTGSRAVHGDILQRYLALGGPAALGLPLSDEYALAGVPGGRVSDFQRGRVFWSVASGAHAVYGAIQGKWLQYGGVGGGMGMPTSCEVDVPGIAGARASSFQNGQVFWSPGTGVSAIYGAILQKYNESGGPASALGLPAGDEYATGAGRRQNFTGGYIYWTAPGGAVVHLP